MDDKIGFYGRLLWVDDEIEMLRAQIYFLEKKGYEIIKASNGTDAIDICSKTSFDLILLDENMPGLSGLETLQRIKEIQPEVPVVMVTKSEEENIMNQAIGSKIADYLIKPVNPNQILLSLKKNIHKKEILSEVTQTSYRQEFAKLGEYFKAVSEYELYGIEPESFTDRAVQMAFQITARELDYQLQKLSHIIFLKVI